MPNGDYLPAGDEELMVWAQNASALITANATGYGLTAGIATTLAGLVSTFADAVAAAASPATRGSSSVFAKKEAKDALVDYVRPMVRTIQGTQSVTPQMKHDLGITVRDTVPSPIPAPADAPVVEVASMNGWMAKLKLKAAGSERRGKPPFVVGVNIYTFVGPTPPTDIDAWKFEGESTRSIVDVQFAAALAVGTKVWVTCCWKNPRLQTGPACAPIGLLIGGGVTTLAA